MWNSNMIEIAKERQADFRREAQRNHMVRIAECSERAPERAGQFFRRFIEHAGEWIGVHGNGKPTLEAAGKCEQLAC